MKEALIRKKVITELEKKDFTCWFPKKVKFQETDVFGVFDVLAIKGRKVRWVQLTTITNIKAREKKVLDFLRKTKSLIVGEIWGYDKKKRIFKIIKVKI